MAPLRDSSGAGRTAVDAGGAAPVVLADIEAAARRLAGVALRTPLLPYGPLDDASSAPRAWLKPENLQAIGAFKIRGAYNALATLTRAEQAAGVVTHSSGNHAQGIARAARLLGIHAVIVMPHDAPAIKVAGVERDGAEIDFVGADNEERIRRADLLAERRGLVLIPSYHDARIVAGQGTVGLEIVQKIGRWARAPNARSRWWLRSAVAGLQRDLRGGEDGAA